MSTPPPPGWYPSPGGDPAWLQYWDGSAWTPHRVPAQPTAGPVPPRSPSGMRRVDAVFDDGFRAIRGAWRPMLGIGLATWGCWTLLAVMLVLGAGAPSVLRDLTADPGRLPPGLPRLGFALGAAALAALGVAAVHTAAALRLGAEAAAGRSATWAVGWRGAAEGAWRLLGYGLLFAGLVALAAGAAAWLAAAAISGGAPALGLLAGSAGLAAVVAIAALAVGRFSPALVQATMDRGALAWSWRATAGRFWAVLGRYLLWSVLASAAINAISSAAWLLVSLPLGASAAGGPLELAGVGAVLAIAAIGLTSSLGAFGMLGAVAVWRDLTTLPQYRSTGGGSDSVTR